MAKRNTSISLLHTIICDDIRREDNGKLLLIGVYPEVIMVNVFPANLVLSIWMQFKMHMLEKTSLEFEIRGDTLQETMPFTLDITDEQLFGKNEAIPLLVKLPFNIKAPGDFTIYYRKKGEQDWIPAETVMVKRNVSPTLQ